MQNLSTELNNVLPYERYGRVTTVQGLLVEAGGIEEIVSVGSRVSIETRGGLPPVLGEVIGFRNARSLIMPFSSLEGVGIGCRVVLGDIDPVIYPSDQWLGRVIDAMAVPIDGLGVLQRGADPYRLRSDPPPAHMRQRVEGKIDLGVRALNTFVTACNGQRLGIFAGSGVGKSVLLSMLAKYTATDVAVVGLIGERGREVQEFIQENLGPEGLARSVVIVATGDESALRRRQAAYMTLTVAEYFRRQGRNVLCLMDSVTRFAMAQREIGLSMGEPPASKGYTPTVFSELPRLLERAGPGPQGEGNITGLFTVLVEGDDHNEPISDAVRGILDGHIVLERGIADRGRYPAINILRSVSRVLPGANTEEENAIVQRARGLLATYEDMAELVRIGAYRQGSDPKVDEAIQYNEALEGYLSQRPHDQAQLRDGYAQLAQLLGMPYTGM